MAVLKAHDGDSQWSGASLCRKQARQAEKQSQGKKAKEAGSEPEFRTAHEVSISPAAHFTRKQ
jgi:hypothetical protein